MINGQMSRGDIEALKSRIRSELSSLNQQLNTVGTTGGTQRNPMNMRPGMPGSHGGYPGGFAPSGSGIPNPHGGYPRGFAPGMPNSRSGYPGGFAPGGSGIPNASAYNPAKVQPGTPRNNAPAGMQTLNPEEFHPKTMIAGSTGAYSDMTGGARFTEYDCGHEYNDSVIRDSGVRTISASSVIKAAFKDKTTVRNAFIMSELFDRPGRRRYKHNFK